MIVLGIDTCDARGSVAVRRAGATVSVVRHEGSEEYSSWLLPATAKCLEEAGVGMEAVELLAVATGPGSFTGVRVGLTVVKAWAELYGKRVAGVSRLEVMARETGANDGYVAASYDAQRGQVFGGLYRVDAGGAWRVEEQDMVIAPEEFVSWVGRRAGDARVRWIALDPELLRETVAWKERGERGETLELSGGGLAAGVAELGEERARGNAFTDVLLLDANYVRRSDAEIFWKDPRSNVG